MLELITVLLLLTSICKLTFKAYSLPPLQFVVTTNFKDTVGPELGKKILYKNQNNSGNIDVKEHRNFHVPSCSTRVRYINISIYLPVLHM